ncbi:MAG TPA: TlpA disulfide reductase family protein [Desulfurivibrionaceae bacterium]|nr:TlpA disulfide reductase family protein [Desulfurivibrionaceae bacterium]
MSSLIHQAAPPWQVTGWLNAPAALTPDALRGQVVVLVVFQMLCPSCVSQALPQALRVHHQFPLGQVAVVGLHSVFEHHAVMNAEALRAFLQQYRIPFAVGIDAHDSGKGTPLTMRAYALEGTPSLVLIDRGGRLRLKHFGRIEDLRLGAEIAALLAEPIEGAT